MEVGTIGIEGVAGLPACQRERHRTEIASARNRIHLQQVIITRDDALDDFASSLMPIRVRGACRMSTLTSDWPTIDG
jgi:hypothetical protein